MQSVHKFQFVYKRKVLLGSYINTFFKKWSKWC